MMRLMGLIVMVIAVEFFFSGLKPNIIRDNKITKNIKSFKYEGNKMAW